jgi:hypothetical protein
VGVVRWTNSKNDHFAEKKNRQSGSNLDAQGTIHGRDTLAPDNSTRNLLAVSLMQRGQGEASFATKVIIKLPNAGKPDTLYYSVEEAVRRN